MLRKTLVSVAIVLFLSEGLRASIRVLPTTEAGTIVCDTLNVAPLSAQPQISFIPTVYQDWGSATGSHPAGIGVLQGAITTGLNKLDGDDLHLVGNIHTALISMGWSVANTNPPSTSGDAFGIIQGEIDFFRQSNFSFIGGFLWGLDFTSMGGLPGGSSVRIFLNDGALSSLSLWFDTDDIYAISMFTAVSTLRGTDQDPSLVGLQIRNPVGPMGSSRDELVLNGIPTPSPLGVGLLGNTSFSLRIGDSIGPEPSSLTVLAGISVVLLGRRNPRKHNLVT